MLDMLTVLGDAATITKVTSERVRTLEDLIRVCAIDTDTWEVTEWTANKWDQAGFQPIGATNRVVITELYQVKARLRRKVEVLAARDEIAALKAEAKKAIVAVRPAVTRRYSAITSPYALQINIFDLHVGKLAWAPETGHASYDSRIARKLFGTALEALIARTSGNTFSKIVLPLGNDLFNTDNTVGTTTAGTPQSTDSRYHKTFLTVRQMMTWACERLAMLAPVEVVIVPGNHDKLAAWHLGDSLDCMFHDRTDIRVDNEPTPRKYIEHGKVMLCFTHGDKVKRENYPLLMATERPEMFGRTRYRECHTGHFHQVKLQEHNGVRVRICPALCPPDAWHAEGGFTGQQRAAEAYVWHADEGLVGMAMYTVPAGSRDEKS
jgi:hypothetical protein